MRRLSGTRAISLMMNGYEKFPNQVIRENGELVEEAIMGELEQINHVEALWDENWNFAMIEELKDITGVG